MSTHTPNPAYHPTWYVYTNDVPTDRIISGHMIETGRQDEDFLRSATVTDIPHEVPLWRVRRDDIRALKSAKKSKGLIFRTYLQMYPDGPIFNADQNMPPDRNRKVVLMVSGERGPDELRILAERETARKAMVSHLVLFPEDPALTKDFMRRGFIQEVHLYDGTIGGELGKLLDYATSRNIRVVGIGNLADLALKAVAGGKRRRAA